MKKFQEVFIAKYTRNIGNWGFSQREVIINEYVERLDFKSRYWKMLKWPKAKNRVDNRRTKVILRARDCYSVYGLSISIHFPLVLLLSSRAKLTLVPAVSTQNSTSYYSTWIGSTDYVITDDLYKLDSSISRSRFYLFNVNSHDACAKFIDKLIAHRSIHASGRFSYRLTCEFNS